MIAQRSIAAVVLLLILGSALWAQVERVLPLRGNSSLEGTSFVVGFMQNEVVEIDEEPRLQVFISAQFDATVTFTSPIAGTYSVVVPANTVHVETLNSDHVNTSSEVIQRKSVFITSDVPIVVYALNTLAQSTDSYTAIPIRHLGTNYRTVNRPTDRYNGTQYYNQLPRVGEFMVMAVEDNTIVTIDTPVPTARRRRAVSVTLRKGDCYLVQALATATGADDLTGSIVQSSKPVALISGHVRSSMPTDQKSSKDHLVEQLPPVDKWGKMHATAPMVLMSSQKPPDVFRVVASKENQLITCEVLGRSFSWMSDRSLMWFDTTLREPAYWHSDDPFLLVQCMPSGGTVPQNYDPAMVVVPPVEQFVNSALFHFPKLEINEIIVNQQFFYFLNVIATADAISTLRVDMTLLNQGYPEIRTQTIPGTALHWGQVMLAEGSHVIACDTGSFTAIMYGTTTADSYANLVGVSYEPLRKRDVTPPDYALTVDCGTVMGEVRDVSRDTARLQDVYVVNAQTKNYRWTITPVNDTSSAMIIEATVQDPMRDAQLVIHAYDDKGNGKEWKYVYDAPALSVQKTVTLERKALVESCTTVVIRNTDTSAVRISSAYIVGDSRITVSPSVSDTLLKAKDSLTLKICVQPSADSKTISAVLRIQMPCLYRTVAVTALSSGTLQGSDVDFGDVRMGDTACAPLSIVNTGSTPLTLTTAILEEQTRGMRIDTTGLMLPRTMKPGDQIWVRVCFTPLDTGVVTRADTVLTSGGVSALLVARGRGVRPYISSVVIDWGRRRVGTTHDTVVVLRNTGSCSARLRTSLGALIDPFSLRGNELTDTQVLPADSVPVIIRFAPSMRGAYEDSETVTVDWRYHEPISITVRGIGILPEIELADIDMGVIEVGASKDSLVQILNIGPQSNAPLVIDSIQVLGPDARDFRIPSNVTSLRGVNIAAAVADSIRFTPSRVGPHLCAVEVVHNAGVNLPVHDTFFITGRGIEPAVPELSVDLSGSMNARACADAQVNISIANSGNAIAVLEHVAVIVGTDTTVVSSLPNRIVVQPKAVWTYTHNYTPSEPGMLKLQCDVVDSAGTVYTEQRTVVVKSGRGQIELGWDSLPPSNPAVLLTGFHTLRGVARVDDTLHLSTVPQFIVSIPKERFSIIPSAARVVWTKENGIDTIVATMISVVQTDSQIIVTCGEVFRAPWQCSIQVGGNILWKNDSVFSVSAVMVAAPCLEDAQSQLIDITTVPCGSQLREVLLGQVPRIHVRPLHQPSEDVVSLEVESNVEASIFIAVTTLSGEEFHAHERFTLQKGIQHCNFSCSDWTPGLYGLVIYQGADIVDRKIIIVN